MLATRMFFWWGESTPPPASISATTATSGGSGRFHEYERLDDHFWMVRERYLRRLERREEPIQAPPPAEEVAEARLPTGTGEESRLLRSRQNAIAVARGAADRETLAAAVQKITEIERVLAELRRQYYDDTLMILLLDA